MEWEAYKAPEGQWSPAYYIEVKGGPDIVADVYDIEGDGGRSAAYMIAAAPQLLEVVQELVDSVDPAEHTSPLLKKAFIALQKASDADTS